jgi:glycosyltransferase involved in cell wall biosynthesis
MHRLYPQAQGGTEIHVTDLIQRIANPNHIAVVFTKQRRDQDDYLIEEKLNGNVTTYTLVMPILSNKPRYFKDFFFQKIYILKAFWRVLGKERIDVVHFHHLIEFTSLLPILCRLKKIPSVIDLVDYFYICPAITMPCKGELKRCGDDCWWQSPKNILENFLKKRAKSILKCGYGKVNVWIYRQWWKWVVNSAVDVIFPISLRTKRIYGEHGFKVEKMRLKACGIEMVAPDALNQDRKLSIRDGSTMSGRVIGFVGAVYKEKGVEVLIQAFKKLNSSSVNLDIYGKSKYSEVEMNQLIEGDSRISMKGEFDHKEIYNVLHQIDILVVPSIWEEAYGLIVDEGLRAEKVVIVSDTGGMRERITDGVNGFLVEAGNIGDLSDKLAYVLEDYDKIVKKLDYRLPYTIENEAEVIRKTYHGLRTA